jgi:hypothetical protein
MRAAGVKLRSINSYRTAINGYMIETDVPDDLLADHRKIYDGARSTRGILRVREESEQPPHNFGCNDRFFNTAKPLWYLTSGIALPSSAHY